MQLRLALFALIAWPISLPAQEANTLRRGTAAFVPADQQAIPATYRLTPHKFDWEMKRQRDWTGLGFEVWEVRFPSPVTTPSVENNTVHAEYYRPKKPGPFPCVIVLDITGGDQSLTRTIARHLAQKDIAGLFVQMAYYGPRRPKGSSLRLLSHDIDHTIASVRQSVLDMRRAAAWMETQPEIDRDRLGILGTSLGSFVAALSSEMEPKLGRLAVLLGGGGFIDGYYDHPEVRPHRQTWEALGGTRAMLKEIVAPIDPLTNADLLKKRQVLIVAAKKDEIVPPSMAEALWKASGQQNIVWLNAGHYTAILYLPGGLKHVVDHFGAPH